MPIPVEVSSLAAIYPASLVEEPVTAARARAVAGSEGARKMLTQSGLTVSPRTRTLREIPGPSSSTPPRLGRRTSSPLDRTVGTAWIAFLWEASLKVSRFTPTVRLSLSQ